MKKTEILALVKSKNFDMPQDKVSLEAYAEFAPKIRVSGHEVTIWDSALEKALSEHNAIYLPDRHQAYYISRSIILRNHQSLLLDPQTIVCAVPGMNTAMVRNEHPLPGNQLPEPDNIARDHDISISGGIWDYHSETTTKVIGQAMYDAQGSITGMHGVFSFSNVKRLQITNLEIRRAACFAIQLGNAEDVEVSHLIFRDISCDGLHANGPLSNGYFHHLVSEGTGDDIVALNAWDWVECHVTCGTIQNIVVEECECRGGYSCMRILPGVKTYFDGSERECEIYDVVFHKIRGVKNFKMYSQGFPAFPSYSQTGKLDNIYFDGIYDLSKLNRIPFDPPYCGQGDRAACFEIMADVGYIELADLHGDFDFTDNPVIVAVGPISMTLLGENQDPYFALELFPVNHTGVVRHLKLGPVYGKGETIAGKPDTLVKAFTMSVKPDFSAGKDIARGGNGSGTIERLTIV